MVTVVIVAISEILSHVLTITYNYSDLISMQYSNKCPIYHLNLDCAIFKDWYLVYFDMDFQLIWFHI